jgi:hypothetical protein
MQLRAELEALSLAALRERVRAQGMVDAGYARRAPYIEQLLWHARETERQARSVYASPSSHTHRESV